MARTKGAIHEDYSHADGPVSASNFAFGLQIGGVLAGVAVILLSIARWKRGVWISESGWGPWPWWLLAAAILMMILAAIAPGVLTPINRVWTAIATIMHTIISPVVMFIVWAIAMTPMGWIMRLLGKDLLRMRIDPSARSYWIVRDPPGPEPASMRNQF